MFKWLKPKCFYWFHRGATAYEFQWRRFGIRWVHLRNGGFYVWNKPWRRLSFQWYAPDYGGYGAKHWPKW